MTRILTTVNDLNFAKAAARLIDEEFDRVFEDGLPEEDAELDSLNHIIGLGFAGLQTFITAVISKSRMGKRAALSVGPNHACGLSMAALINAAANYWKHSSEWDEYRLSSQAQETADTLGRLIADPWLEQPMAVTLSTLVGPHELEFATLIPFLERWSEEVMSQK